LRIEKHQKRRDGGETAKPRNVVARCWWTGKKKDGLRRAQMGNDASLKKVRKNEPPIGGVGGPTFRNGDARPGGGGKKGEKNWAWKRGTATIKR